MGRQTNHKKKIIKYLEELSTGYPNQNMCLHLSMILADYTDFDTLSDKEFLFLIEKYSCEKSLDFYHPDSDIEKIVKEAQDLDHILDEEDEDF